MARKAKTNDDSTAIEQEEILTKQLADEVEKQIVAQDAHDDYYDNRQMIPADNVDADGVPWVTVGENIRKGAKYVDIDNLILKMLSALTGVNGTKYEFVNIVKSKNLTPGFHMSPDNTAVFKDKGNIVGFFLLKTDESQPINANLLQYQKSIGVKFGAQNRESTVSLMVITTP